jgi:HAD superfamily hydrolase (TIGR01662 family)
MALFLPHQGWHVKFHQDPEEYEDSELTAEIREANVNLLEVNDEAVFPADYDTDRLQKAGLTEWVKPIWYWTYYDPVPFPDDPLGEMLDACGCRSLAFYDRELALQDLAKVYEPVRVLLALCRSGPAAARPLARAGLEGDRAALGVLADALEEAGHEQAQTIRDLTVEKPEPKKTRARKAKGRPAAPPPAPAEASQVEAAATAARRTGQEIVLVGGMPAGGKTTYIQALLGQGYRRLNRDERGGKVDDLLPGLDALLAAGEPVVLDNLYATRASRAGAVRLARQRGVPVRFVLLDTSLEDAQFNACLRMIERCGRVLHPEDHKRAPYKDDPSLFPVAVLYKYRNDFQEPEAGEGFVAVEKVKFVRRWPPDWVNKALLFDFDGTLRTHKGKEKYPTRPSEVRALLPRAARVRFFEAQGYLLLGASNQSGIAKGTLTAADAEACFAETQRQLGLTFQEVRYCPHKVPPISCYCRKPGPGLGVELIVKYKLDPRQCYYVGDAGTDRSFAARCGFQFVDQKEFFGLSN